MCKSSSCVKLLFLDAPPALQSVALSTAEVGWDLEARGLGGRIVLQSLRGTPEKFWGDEFSFLDHLKFKVLTKA